MLSAIETADTIRTGHCSARESVAAALAKVTERNPAINAFVHLDALGALKAADAVDAALARGDDPGPLAGVPFGVKDNEAVAGMPTRQGSLLLADAPPERRDSTHVARLRRAGAIPIGKLAMSEFGLDGVTHTLAHGTTRNPWDLSRTPSGSSGGSSAAVAAGMVPFATGSDGLGSVRCPAGFTGLVGLKPSMGRIPRMEGFRDTSSVGPLTTTIADIARYLDIVSGPDDRDRMSLPRPSLVYESAVETLEVAGLRAVYSPDLGFAPVSAEVANLCEEAARRLCNAARLDLSAGSWSCTNAYVAWNALAARTLRAEFEVAGYWPEFADCISPGPRAFIESVGEMSVAEELDHRAVLKRLERETAEFFDDADFLITPTASCEAYAAEGPLPIVIEGRDASHTNAEPFTTIGSICWQPSISIPAGITRAGLPVGLMITGRRHQDETILRLARIWELTSPWPRIAPQ